MLYVYDVTGSGWLGVVGESHRREELAIVVASAAAGPRGAADRTSLTWALLQADPTNAHDSNAIEVVISGLQVGFLSAANAVRFASFFGRHRAALCPALVSPAGDGQWGVRLRVHYPCLEGHEAPEPIPFDELEL